MAAAMTVIMTAFRAAVIMAVAVAMAMTMMLGVRHRRIEGVHHLGLLFRPGVLGISPAAAFEMKSRRR